MKVIFKYKKVILLPILFLLIINSIVAQNPPIKGISDPHIRVFNDTIYLYSGHDDSPDDKLWVMKDWRVFSTTDLVDWKLETVISPKDNFMGENSKDCWATDATTKNGKYFFYFSDRDRSIGVMSADKPTGPFKDMLGKPLVKMHDPTVIIDDDIQQTPYLIYGCKRESYFIVKLNNDMISLAEEPKPIVINGKEWETAPKFMDKNYIFKYNDTYYLSWGRDYAISKNIYGPYECVGAVGFGQKLDPFAHGSFFWWKGQFYHMWCYYIKNGFKYRESIITYCHFKNDGRIVTDTKFLDKHPNSSVGRYEASWDTIEAEWFYEKTVSISKQDGKDGGFEIAGIENGSWVRYANFNFGEFKGEFSAEISNFVSNGSIEIRIDSPDGKIIGKVNVANSGKSTCNIEKISGKHDLYLVFSGTKKNMFALNSFSFISK